MKVMQGQVKKLKEELQNAINEIRNKEQIIQRFKDWQLADNYLEQDQQMSEAIESQKIKQEQAHEQEAKQMAEAAALTIQTLQSMLDQKNELIKRKEHLIEQLNKQRGTDREQD